MITIREIKSNDELIRGAEVIRNAFTTVSAQYGFTIEDNPTHSSFISAEGLMKLREKGAKMFGCFKQDTLVGFVALEYAGSKIYYLEKLAVIPEHRHNGYGRRILDHAVEYVLAQGGEKISIGIIDEHKVLKDWYKDYGFKEKTTRKFPDFPFTVCFMEMRIK